MASHTTHERHVYLPPEIILEVGRYLDDQTIRSLRKLSRHFQRSVQDEFLKRHFRESTIYLSDYDPIPWSSESVLAGAVEVLSVDPWLPRHPSGRALEELLYKLDSDPSFDSKEAHSLLAKRTYWVSHHQEARALLASRLANFPRLSKVVLTQESQLRIRRSQRFERDLQLAVHPSQHDLVTQVCRYDFAPAKALNMVLGSAASKEIPIRSLRVDLEDRTELSKLLSLHTLLGLQVLELNGPYDIDHGVLNDFLSRHKALQKLRIGFPFWTVREVEEISFPADHITFVHDSCEKWNLVDR